MKTLRTLLIVAAVASAFSFSACSEKKQNNDIIAKKPEAKRQTTPVKMQNYDHKENVDWLGQEYRLDIKRRVDTSLPMIVDETGGKYYDNKITVSVTRPDGTVFFDKTFTKADFSEHINESYMAKSALLGIVVDHVEGDNIVFAASVGAPDVLSDDYLPLLVTLSRTGNVSIEKDKRNLEELAVTEEDI